MKSGRFPKTDACKQDGRCFTDDLTKEDKAAVESKRSLEGSNIFKVFMASEKMYKYLHRGYGWRICRPVKTCSHRS